MGKLIDLTGQVFGRLTVIERDFEHQQKLNSKAAYWKCICSCDQHNTVTVAGTCLRNGNTKSCGCLRKEQARLNTFKDLTGQNFGELIVLYQSGTQKNHALWRCKCSCGKKIDVISNSLLTGNTRSCGHLQKEMRQSFGERTFVDLTNQQFGYLIALEPTEERTSDNKVIWKCLCTIDNNICYVSSRNLKNGHTYSCGCIKSIGETNIQKILLENNVKFEKEKTFNDLINLNTKCKYRYDFYLPDYNRLIEFDGEQHYGYADLGWNTKEHFEKTLQSDKIKNEYALSHNIPLVRIPYWERDTITLEMILGDKYLETGEEKIIF